MKTWCANAEKDTLVPYRNRNDFREKSGAV